MYINIIDILAIIVLGYALFKGYKKGFINIFFDALALVGAFYTANQVFPFIDNWVKEVTRINYSWFSFVTLALTYALVFLAFKLTGMGLTKLFKKTLLGRFNQIAGMIINCFKWFLVILVVVLVLLKIPHKKFQNFCKDSYIYASYKGMAAIPLFRELLPKKLAP